MTSTPVNEEPVSAEGSVSPDSVSAEDSGAATETAGTETAETGPAETERAEMAAAATETAATETAGAEAAEAAAAETDTAGKATAGRPDRTAVVIAAVLILVCGGLVGYGLLGSEDKPTAKPVPTAEVTYEVQGRGTVEISYQARSQAGSATVESDVELPWRKTVRVPLGKDPSVSIVLDEKGGEASCTLAIRGEHVQRATAFGEFGRATCTGALPAPTPAPTD